MKKEKRSKRTSAADTRLRLDAIFGSKNPAVSAFFERACEEETAVYIDWLDKHSSADGCTLLVPAKEAAREYQKVMDRVNARAGYRFIHMLSPVMRRKLREVYPLPPRSRCGGASAFGMTG
jgi:hypothetical protein